MSNDKYEYDLPTHAAINFEGVERQLLDAYAEILNVPVKASAKDDEVREALMNKLGVSFAFDNETGEHLSAPVTPKKKLNMTELYELNLSGRGAWQGRRRMLVLSRPENYRGDQPLYFGWGRQSYWIRPNQEVSVPLPIFNIVRNARPKRLTQVRKTLDDGTQTVRNIFTEYQRIPYSDMGDDPDTLHLPISQKEQFRLIAGLTNNFSTFKGSDGKAVDFTENQLRAVAQRLSIEVKDLPTDGASGIIRSRILRKLSIAQGLEAIA